MGGRCVDDAHVGVLDELRRLDGALVGQAEEHDVGSVQELAPLFDVVTLVLVDSKQLQVVARADALVDLQPRRAALSVDIYPGCGHVAPRALVGHVS